MVLPLSKESDSRRDSQKPERAIFLLGPSYVFYLLSLAYLPLKKYENIIVAKKIVILKPRLPAFMDLLVVTIYN